MKLNSFRLKDAAHIEVLDKCGLISPAIEATLPTVLQERLQHARSLCSDDEY